MTNDLLVKKARDLMRRQTLANKAPIWAFTEIAINKAGKLMKKYKVRKDLVLVGTYLADCVSFKKSKGKFIRVDSHEELSARFAEKYLRKWKVPRNDMDIILNSIRAHHENAPALSTEAEVVKAADCFKFLSMEGILALMHTLGTRNMSLNEAVKFAKERAREKLGYISLPGLKKEATANYKEIILFLNSIPKK
jgi:HD superfamily phosphodiesterase